jgi:DNA-binding Lrp family transcriptional regulator
MDRTDLRIFSRLVGDPFVSDEHLGREVGLTGKAVRLRRQRMETEGVLAEYGVHPRAEILGRHAVTCGYVGGGESEPPVARLTEIEDLVYVRRFRPNFHQVVRFTRQRDPTPDPRLARWFGRPLPRPFDEPSPESSIGPDHLSRADWAVLEAVVRAPRGPNSVRSREAHLSTRSFRLHQSKLEAAGAWGCAMILNLEREAGLATYGIWLKVDESFDERSLGPLRLWDRPHWTRNPRGVYLLGSGENYFEARALELRLGSLPGVVAADPLIPAGGFFARERLLTWIRAEREHRTRSSRSRGADAGPAD